ncbi:uncharacterized protein LOC130367402 [Hyla sarda]|uniref:uncharacterized protein LOC130367402 n=1 Tax=Hyla sarda TaxID=327740 RepID=UPI0024C46AFA|nr:uncharacterized protein LOC130367402 [Hyla sarda]
MPSCIVKGCPSTSRRRDPSVIMHSFPWDVSRIRIWLQKTGQFENNLDQKVQQVLNGKVNDSFRMCSLHFDNYSYHHEADRRILLKDAVPTIFPPRPQRSLPSTVQQNLPGVETCASVSICTSSDITVSVLTTTSTVVTWSVASAVASTVTTASSQFPGPISSILSISSTVIPLQAKSTLEHPPLQKKLKTGHLSTSYAASTISETVTFSATEPQTTSTVLTSSMSSIIPIQSGSELEIPITQASNSSFKRKSSPERRSVATNTTPFIAHQLQSSKFEKQRKKCKKSLIGIISQKDLAEAGPSTSASFGTVSSRDIDIASQCEMQEIENITHDPAATVPEVEPTEIANLTHSPGEDYNILSGTQFKSTTVITPAEHVYLTALQQQRFEKEHNYCVKLTPVETVSPIFIDRYHQPTKSIITEKVINAEESSQIMPPDNSEPTVIEEGVEEPLEHETTISTFIDIEDTSFHATDMEEEPDDFSEIDSEDNSNTLVPGFEDLYDVNEDVVRDMKFLIFESAFKKLIRMIPCPAKKKSVCRITHYKKNMQGSMFSLHVKCNKGHIRKLWKSQPLVNNTPAGNVLLSAATVVSGNSISKIFTFLKFLNMLSIGRSTFFNHQNNFIFPGIDKQWQKEQKSVIDKLKLAPAYLIGDGQCDSPGFSAKYCTYTLMDAVTKKICAFTVEQLTPTTTSVSLEKMAFKKTLEELIEKDLHIAKIATDRHVSIRKILREQYPYIEHQFDVWHLAKSVGNKIAAGAKNKANEVLNKWIQPIKNHLWWCSRTCGQDPGVLVERWKSLVYHVCDQHEWTDEDSNYTECLHPPLTEEKKNNTKWLTPKLTPHNVLCKIVLNPIILRDIRQLSSFCHTGELEVYHSIVLKYRPKRIHFYMDSMVARTQLAAMDHNNNVGRIRAVVRKATDAGEPMGTVRHRYEYSKARRAWVVKPVYEPTCQDFLFEVMTEIIEMVRNPDDSDWHSRRESLPRNIAPTPRPDPADLLADYMSRFE